MTLNNQNAEPGFVTIPMGTDRYVFLATRKPLNKNGQKLILRCHSTTNTVVPHLDLTFILCYYASMIFVGTHFF